MTKKRRIVERWAVLGCFAAALACGGEEREQAARLVSLDVSPPEAVVFLGETLALEAIGSFEGGRQEAMEAAWSSSDPTVGTVDPERLEVSALFPGEITIEANAGGLVGTARIAVRARSTMARIEPGAAHLLPGDTLALAWVAVDPAGALVDGAPTWSSSHPEVAEIGPDGIVSARGAGSATIQGAWEGIEAAAHLVVSPLAPESVVIHAEERRLEVGSEVRLEATVLDRDGQPMPGVGVQWISESPTVVSVDATGKALILRPTGGDVLAQAGDAVGRIRLEGIIDYVQAVANGEGSSRTTCAVDRQGRAYCWGDNSYNQLGDGLSVGTKIPKRIEWLPKLTRIDAPAGDWPMGARLRFYGIAADGLVFTWGQGVEDRREFAPPYRVARRIVREVYDGIGVKGGKGPGVGCDLTQKGALICDGEQMVREGAHLPLEGDPEPAHAPIVEVAGAWWPCWRYDSGEVSCSGHDRYRGTDIPWARVIDLPGPARALAAARGTICALLEGGEVHCWQGLGGRFTASLQAEAPGPVTALTGDYESICGATDGGWVCWREYRAHSLESTHWLGPPVLRGFANMASYDPISELGVDPGGTLWHLGDPPTRAPGQR